MKLVPEEEVYSMLNMHLKENLEDDPYGTVSFIIRGALDLARTRMGLMSDYEAETLRMLARVLKEGDS